MAEHFWLLRFLFLHQNCLTRKDCVIYIYVYKNKQKKKPKRKKKPEVQKCPSGHLYGEATSCVIAVYAISDVFLQCGEQIAAGWDSPCCSCCLRCHQQVLCSPAQSCLCHCTHFACRPEDQLKESLVGVFLQQCGLGPILSLLNLAGLNQRSEQQIAQQENMPCPGISWAMGQEDVEHRYSTFSWAKSCWSSTSKPLFSISARVLRISALLSSFSATYFSV